MCQWRQVCRNYNFSITTDFKYECFMKFCTYGNKKQHSGHYCYVVLLKLSRLSNRYMFVFYDMEFSQDLERSDGFFENVPKLRTSYALSKCVQSVKSLRILISIANNVASVCTSSGMTLYVNLLNISGCLDHLLIKFVLFHITLVDTTHIFC